MFFGGCAVGAIVLALFLGLCAANTEKPCNTCKYRRMGTNTITGEIQEPCCRCCHKYEDLYVEVQR